MKKDHLRGQIHCLLNETIPKKKLRNSKPLLISAIAGGAFVVASMTMAVQIKSPPAQQTSSDRVLNHFVSQIRPVKNALFAEVGEGLYLMDDGYIVALRIPDPI